MKNYKLWLAVVIILLIINSGVLALMWFHKSRPGHGNYGPAMEPKDILISTLSLTTKQQELFAVMRNKHRQLTNTLSRQNHLLHDSLFNYIKAPKIDTALINRLSDRISNNQSLVEKATLYHFRELRAILTMAQQQKFDSIIQDVVRMMSGPGRKPGQRLGGLHGEESERPQGPPPEDMRPGQNLPPEGPPHN
ncbi:Spy/CpxP family protein refolding chaperone [Mucilaginibacter paludis]|uniref:Periplasmic heavy metal sensor n=1 Tax=Mucilaginibacter paludis DSM 18603 TaxID=714943 RepID=H1Y500_9SPHI|nr:periplasmic heavy metal sensor [Mucilaginibacter paludis]EHQ28328.1 hypothetical protein Mucpa_4237 [Mucilaginibacter paludis DSM 18603]